MKIFAVRAIIWHCGDRIIFLGRQNWEQIVKNLPKSCYPTVWTHQNSPAPAVWESWLCRSEIIYSDCASWDLNMMYQIRICLPSGEKSMRESINEIVDCLERKTLTWILCLHRWQRRTYPLKVSSNIVAENSYTIFGRMGPWLWLTRWCRGYHEACEDVSYLNCPCVASGAPKPLSWPRLSVHLYWWPSLPLAHASVFFQSGLLKTPDMVCVESRSKSRPLLCALVTECHGQVPDSI